jgi:hypothetical protein
VGIFGYYTRKLRIASLRTFSENRIWQGAKGIYFLKNKAGVGEKMFFLSKLPLMYGYRKTFLGVFEVSILTNTML